MRDMPSSDLVSLISFLVMLMIFYSIDMKARERRNRASTTKESMFTTLSHAGGVATSVALAVAWIDLFLPDENEFIHVLLVALPGSVGVLCAIILSVELLFIDISDDDSGLDNGDRSS